ncbi:glycosyltransferase family 9 protein [Erwinia aphidicola]|uniref:glycosyltransferase family 9 protein n=1 Tax=Erwinia aphidicola TaxID=68334 RepID=UPI003CF75583
MFLISLLRQLAFSLYDYRAIHVVPNNIEIAVIHIPDQIGDAMSVFPIIRSLEQQRIKHLIIVASRMNQSVFDALSLNHTELTVIAMNFQDKASLKEIKEVAKRIRNHYGKPDICIEAMRKKNLKTMCFISHLRAKTNLQAVGLLMKCYATSCEIASRMDQQFRAPVPMTWAILMREAGFPTVRASFEFPLSEETLSEVSQQTHSLEHYIAFNFEGSVQERTFSLPVARQLVEIITESINLPIIIVHGPKGKDNATELVKSHPNVHQLSLPPSIGRSAAVIKNAFMAITPDTSILHIASAYNIPTIAVYSNYKTRWPPMQDFSETIVVGNYIDHINLNEFRNSLRSVISRIPTIEGQLIKDGTANDFGAQSSRSVPAH